MDCFADGWTEKDIEAAIERNNPDELLRVPIIVGMNAPDCEQAWAENVCCSLCEHPHFNVRGNAILGLGHIARTCRKLDLDRAVPLISNAFNDPHEYVRSHANNAACELELYLGVTVPGYDGNPTTALLEAIDRVVASIGGV